MRVEQNRARVKMKILFGSHTIHRDVPKLSASYLLVHIISRKKVAQLEEKNPR